MSGQVLTAMCVTYHHFREQAMREARYSRSSHGRSVTALAGKFSSVLTAIKLNCVAFQHTKDRVVARTAVILR